FSSLCIEELAPAVPADVALHDQAGAIVLAIAGDVTGAILAALLATTRDVAGHFLREFAAARRLSRCWATEQTACPRRCGDRGHRPNDAAPRWIVTLAPGPITFTHEQSSYSQRLRSLLGHLDIQPIEAGDTVRFRPKADAAGTGEGFVRGGDGRLA